LNKSVMTRSLYLRNVGAKILGVKMDTDKR